MMLPLMRAVGSLSRILVAAACCWGIWQSLLLARADSLFKQDTELSVRAAIGLVPDEPNYYMRLSEIDSANAQSLLTKSLRFNRFNAQADIELGLQYEIEGDLGQAEKQLLQAYDVNHTYMPRWTLANFYFRRNNMPEFWRWARSAAAMPKEDIGALFVLCWRASPDAGQISKAILNENPDMIRQYIRFLLGRDQVIAAAGIAPLLFRTGDAKSDLPMMFAVVDKLVLSSDGSSAGALWRRLSEQNWVTADSAIPYNGGFLREPLGVVFDWSLPDYPDLHSWPGPSGLETEFSGNQPEEATIAEQALVLKPGKYAMSYSYRTTDISPASGIRWQILDAETDTVLEESAYLSSDALLYSGFGFSVPPTAPLVRVRLDYQRALGTPRISGMLDVSSTRIQSLP
jgi:hypothetical protein